MSTKPNIQVAVGLLIDDNQGLLLGQRPAGKPYAGWWELPGGKLEPTETVLQALHRELAEEIGIKVTASKEWVHYVHEYTHATVSLHFCLVTQWTGQIQGLEAQQLQWVKVSRANAEQIQQAQNDRLSLIHKLNEHSPEAERLMAESLSPTEALGLQLSPNVTPLLPASLPPLKWLQLPTEYAITAITKLGVERFLTQLDQALKHGVKLIQFREPNWPQGADAQDLYQVLQLVLERTKAAGAKVLVNSIHPQRWWSQADGVHLQSHVTERPKLKTGQWLAMSTHNESDLALARQLKADFVVLGPVLTTNSHPDTLPIGWSRFTELALQANMPVYALGGMQQNLMALAHSHQAFGIAGIQHFWNHA